MPLDTNHPSFRAPHSAARLWRYMEFAKFVSLMTSQSLWFCNLDLLARDDPFEASFPRPNLDHRRWNAAADMSAEAATFVRAQMREGELFEQALRRVVHNQDGLIRSLLAMRKFYFVNCWHMFPTESAAMWKSYGKHDSAVAITSSLERMSRALANQPVPIFCGVVDYIDFETDSIDSSNAFNLLIKKRLTFHSENEVRLVWWDTDLLLSASGKSSESIIPPNGQAISCALHDLIDEIWISPTSPEWLAETIRSFCSLIGFEARVRRSNLLDQPFQ
jgi:hypothetical protein